MSAQDARLLRDMGEELSASYSSEYSSDQTQGLCERPRPLVVNIIYV